MGLIYRQGSHKGRAYEFNHEKTNETKKAKFRFTSKNVYPKWNWKNDHLRSNDGR